MKGKNRYRIGISLENVKKIGKRELLLVMEVISQEGENCKIILKVKKEKDGFKWTPQKFIGRCSSVRKKFEKIMNDPSTINNLEKIFDEMHELTESSLDYRYAGVLAGMIILGIYMIFNAEHIVSLLPLSLIHI